MEAVKGIGIYFCYEEEDSAFVLDNIDLQIQKGELVAILGHNGCGKSTLVKHFNGLVPLQQGELEVFGMDAAEEQHIPQLRRSCGMVFQNPDNQFVSSIIKEDIAFGLENYDTPVGEIPGRVEAALALTGMEGFAERSPHTLSGGQKQRIALAGVLALEPEMIVFDEATSMLDAGGRREVLEIMEKLHRLGKTIVMITHSVEEAVHADRVLLMDQGRIIGDGMPQEILTCSELLQQAQLIPPLPVRLYEDLKQRGIVLGSCPLTKEALVEELCRLY